jgi:hypothetical protein
MRFASLAVGILLLFLVQDARAIVDCGSIILELPLGSEDVDCSDQVWGCLGRTVNTDPSHVQGESLWGCAVILNHGLFMGRVIPF